MDEHEEASAGLWKARAEKVEADLRGAHERILKTEAACDAAVRMLECGNPLSALDFLKSFRAIAGQK